MTGSLCGILAEHARERPQAPALFVPVGRGGRQHRRVTFGELAASVRRRAEWLQHRGVRPGDRVLLFIPMSEELYVWLLALWWVGGVGVFLDPWMGFRALAEAIERTSPVAMVLPPWGRMLRHVLPVWRKVPACWPTGEPLPVRDSVSSLPFPAPEGHPALVTFTTGSSGRPKGAVRSHGVLLAQHQLLSRELGDGPGDVAMATLPIFTLHHLAAGAAAILPLRHRLAGDEQGAAAAWRQMAALGATLVVVSPALLRSWLELNQTLPGLRAVFVGGGGVDPELPIRAAKVFPAARVAIGYGSTEAEPVSMARGDGPSHAEARERTLAGEGLCVGCPVPGVEIRLREDGEVLVAGPHVVTEYWGVDGLPPGKSRDGAGNLWHAMGDVARQDPDGCLWLLGRTGDPVLPQGSVRHALALESLVTCRGWSRGAALVALQGRPILAVEGGVEPVLREGLAELGLSDLAVVAVRRIPRDPRHRTKVDRVALLRQLARKGYTWTP